MVNFSVKIFNGIWIKTGNLSKGLHTWEAFKIKIYSFEAIEIILTVFVASKAQKPSWSKVIVCLIFHLNRLHLSLLLIVGLLKQLLRTDEGVALPYFVVDGVLTGAE